MGGVAASAPRSLAVAVALGLADVLDEERPERAAAIEQWDAAGLGPEAITIDLDPRPWRAQAYVRSWLLDLDDRTMPAWLDFPA
jgi:hypothetical protein